MTSPPTARKTVHETEAELEARFAAEHPPGSRVQLTHEVADPDRVRGPLAQPGTFTSTGTTTSAGVSGAIAVVLLVAAGFALRGALVHRRG